MKDFLFIVLMVTMTVVDIIGALWLIAVAESIGGTFVAIGITILLISLLIFSVSR